MCEGYRTEDLHILVAILAMFRGVHAGESEATAGEGGEAGQADVGCNGRGGGGL